jgi:hypothetical protein
MLSLFVALAAGDVLDIGRSFKDIVVSRGYNF